VSDTKPETQPAHTATWYMMSYVGPDKKVKQYNCLEQQTHPLLLGYHCDMLLTGKKTGKINHATN